MRAKDLIEGAVEHLQTSASVKTVYGAPITTEGKTVIPVAKVALGGVAARPVGVVEISETGTRFVQFGATRKLAFTAFIGAGIGGLVGWLFGRKRTRA